MICVDATGLRIEQSDRVLLDDLDVTIRRGDRVALVGVNGSGKTSLLRVLAGHDAPAAGEVRFGRDARIAVLDQDPVLPPGTVGEYLGDHWEVMSIASRLGVGDLLDRRTDELSGGQAKRVALAAVLAGNSGGADAEAHDLVILDEPTNHLDLEAIDWIESRLTSMTAALLLVTHDRLLLDRLTTAVGPGRVIELDGRSAHEHRAAAGSSAYAAFLDGRAERLDREAGEEATRKILARRELAWLRRGAPARSSKPKARLRSAAEIVSGGPAGPGARDEALVLGAGTTRLGNQVVELERVGQVLGDRRVLRDVDLLVEPGARLAVVGPNGSGKTTLLDVVSGRRDPAEGERRVGSTVVVGHADQNVADLDGDLTVLKLVAGPYREPDHEDRALLRRFWFEGATQHSPIRMLSGGERRRLQLVTVLAAKPNLLVLDAPTNDLDLATLRSLEDFLDEWPGALVVASHDRAFLDRVADHVLAIEPDGTVRRVPGGVTGWLGERSSASASASAPPPRAGGDRSERRRDAKGRSQSDGPSASTIGRRLRESERAMVKAQAKVDSLTEQVASLAEAGNHTELAERGAELTAAQADLDRLETEWLDLAERFESL